MEECSDSDASSASRKRPGMIYVRERRADSICVTEDWFLVMKELYLESSLGGSEGMEERLWRASLRRFMVNGEMPPAAKMKGNALI